MKKKKIDHDQQLNSSPYVTQICGELAKPNVSSETPELSGGCPWQKSKSNLMESLLPKTWILNCWYIYIDA